jgi:hypothetical protein
MEHPQLDEFIGPLAAQPEQAERLGGRREEMLPWLHEYI